MSTLHSTVKWFDAKKGYGFINHPDGGEDIFVHYSQIESDDDFKTLRTGQSVEFELEDGPKGLHAQSVVAQDEDGKTENAAAEEPEPPEAAGSAGASAGEEPSDPGLAAGPADGPSDPL